MALSVNDALGHYRAVAEATHKYWGYFQAIAAGTAAFAWASETQTLPLLAWLTFAFVLFAIASWRLVVGSQADVVAVKDCIKTFVKNHPSEVPSDFAPLVDRLTPYPAWIVGSWHGLISVAVVAVIWWNHFLL